MINKRIGYCSTLPSILPQKNNAQACWILAGNSIWFPRPAFINSRWMSLRSAASQSIDGRSSLHEDTGMSYFGGIYVVSDGAAFGISLSPRNHVFRMLFFLVFIFAQCIVLQSTQTTVVFQHLFIASAMRILHLSLKIFLRTSFETVWNTSLVTPTEEKQTFFQ